jgi:hypothetical protein
MANVDIVGAYVFPCLFCILLEGIGPTIFVVLKAATSRGLLARIGKKSPILHSIAVRTRCFSDPGSGIRDGKNQDPG